MSPFRYGVGGVSLRSALPLRGLFPAADGGRPEVTAARMETAARHEEPEWPREPKGPRDLIRESEAEPGVFWLRTPDARTHRVNAAAGRVEFDPGSEPGLALTHDVVDFALPNLLSCGDRVVFHGALLETGEGCVAALGESGVGKSTVTARWVRSGGRFLSDDWFVLRPVGGRLLASPSHPSIRLRSRDEAIAVLGGVEESGRQPAFSKLWYSFAPGSASFCGEPRELKGIVFLRRDGAPPARTKNAPPGSREAMAGLVASLVLLDVGSPRRWGLLLPLLARIEAGVRIETANIPTGTDDPAEALRKIEKLGRGAAGNGARLAVAGRDADAL